VLRVEADAGEEVRLHAALAELRGRLPGINTPADRIPKMHHG
jgi:hypothetical protein